MLLNAGHSPSSLARQMVRYLRNALMAKLGGEQTELLQISADERARATRTSMLFAEEDLTRNLQIILRTFDDLNFRQEQRFHLELGLLKLIHAQRLLPLEELLSGVAGGTGGRPTASAPVSRPAPSTSRASAASAPASAPAPALSPFASGSSSPGPKLTVDRAPLAEAVIEAPSAQVTPFPAASTLASGFAEAYHRRCAGNGSGSRLIFRRP